MGRQNHTFLITGAAARIGAAIARRCAAAGAARIILHYHQSHDAANTLAGELRGQGCEVILWQQDLRADDLIQNFNALIGQCGSIDVLINNAAIFYPERDTTGEPDAELLAEMMAINFYAPLALSRAFAAQGGAGNIVNILDQRVLNISHAFPAYTASKAALWALSQNMAQALAPHIRVNAIAPGHILPAAGEAIEMFQARTAKTPLGIGATPEAIAEAVMMILNSPSMTGAIIPLDGGEHMVQKRKPTCD
jgi:NAD(P)-dependent dehydrogenase (short-subunit alcohol dehydrogenase family)